jgi:hypothetical protein
MDDRLTRECGVAIDDDLPFKVEQWDATGNRIERVIARAANLIVGRRAYEAACRQYPKARLTLRQGIRVIEETGQ